jgi:hypothetical protein
LANSVSGMGLIVPPPNAGSMFVQALVFAESGRDKSEPHG